MAAGGERENHVNIAALLQLEEEHEHAVAELLESDEEYGDAEMLDAVM